MEPSTKLFDSVLGPTALYYPAVQWDEDLLPLFSGWENSQFNPKNRIDSLDKIEDFQWRVDGIDVDGTRFFAVPRFAIGGPPLRIDIYIPGQDDHPRHLHETLESGIVMTVKRGKALQAAISRHIMRAIDLWSAQHRDFESQYVNLPFGSKIIVDNIHTDINQMDIHLLPTYDVEQNLHSLQSLQSMWDLPTSVYPKILDLTDLRFHSQPHEAITLVRLAASDESSSLYVFKSLTRSQKYLYHELYTLLTMPPHPHAIGPPLYLVTKRCRFGSKLGIAGFILPYYPYDTLHTLLSSFCSPHHLPLRTILRWTRELADVLLHIAANSPAGFYPDLKPDNVLLVPTSCLSPLSNPTPPPPNPEDPLTSDLHPLLIDFELRGGFPSFTPPEVLHLENLLTIAARLTSCPRVRDKCVNLLRSYFPAEGFPVPPPKEDARYRFQGNEHGFSLAWRSLETREERERAMVFMLGKVVWCLGEGRASAGCGVGVEMLREEMQGWEDGGGCECGCHGPEKRGRRRKRPGFPFFYSTPMCLRPLVRACTQGAPEWAGRLRKVELKGGKIVPLANDFGRCGCCTGLEEDSGATASAAETQEAAREWWREEVRAAKRFVEDVVRRRQTGNEHDGEDANELLKKAKQRPGLEKIVKWLKDLEEQAESGESGGNYSENGY